MVAVDGLLPARQRRPWVVPFERCADRPVGALVALVREGHDVATGRGVDEAVMSGGGQIMDGSGQCG